MAFPTSPTDGQIYNGYRYRLDLNAWLVNNSVSLGIGSTPNEICDIAGGNHGINSGATISKEGLAFDGISNYVEIPNSPSIDIKSSAFTFETSVFPSDYTSTEIYLCNKENQYEVSLKGSSNDSHTLQAAIMTTGGPWEWVDSGYNVPLNTWSYISITYDGTNIRFYVNGNLVTTSPNTFSGDITSIASNLNFGARNPNDAPSNEILNEIRLWNVVRTQAQIQANINKTLTGDEIGLVAYYPVSGNFPTFR